MNTPLGEKAQGANGIRLLTSDHRRPTTDHRPPSSALRLPRPPAAFALVATLLMITVITGAAVAFFQSSRIERFVSRNYADLARAQMAAESGAMLAGALLRSATANDHFIVYANTNRQLFIGNGAGQSANSFLYLPLYSVGTNLASSGSNLAFTTSAAPFRAPTGATFTSVLNLPGGYTVTSPAISWIQLTNAQGRTNARFAFWTEDLAGRVNLSVSGASSSETNEPRRLTGTNPAELAVWTIFSPTSRSYLQAASGVAVMRSLADQRNALLSAASSRLANSNVTNTHLPSLCVGLGQDTNEPQVIPYGYGFQDAGRSKHDLVGIVAAGTNTSVNELRNIISRNLPGLTNRAGGLRLTSSDSVTYLNNLAANIVDFIDADTRVTAGPNYRGVEPLPYLNERATRYFRVGTNDPNVAIVETTEFMEFWNLHDRQTAPITNLTVLYTNIQIMNWGTPRPIGINTNFVVNLPSIPPNGFCVVASPTFRTILTHDGLGPPGSLSLVSGSTNIVYGIQYQGIMYDRGVCGNISEVILSNNRAYFSSGYPALGAKFPIAGQDPATYFSTHGDPRGSFYMTNPQHQVNYGRNSSFGGRNRQAGNTGRANSEVNITNWPDTGHNDVAGTPPASDTTPPATGVFFSQTNLPPARTNPRPGGLASICDLGSVFDPIQWAEVTANLAYNNDPSPGGTWTNLTSTAVPSSINAGGTTLRIGRPEWRRFAFSGGGRPTNMAQSCVGLLEIFASGPTNNGAIVNPIPGRINLNTASPQTLAVLAAGVNHIRDPGLVEFQGGTQITSGTNFYVPNHKVNDFANAVISYRSERPFYSPAELNFLTYTNHSDSTAWPGNAVFHSARMGLVNNSVGDIRSTDAAAEEWFQRIYSHSTVRSRNFMIYVIGQAMSTNTNNPRPLATSQQAFQVYLAPQRAATNGLATNSSLQILGKWSL